NQLEGVIYYLRSEHEIDDTVTKILIEANEVSSTNPALPKDPERLFLPDEVHVPEMLGIISTFESKYLKISCFDEAYKNMYFDIHKLYSKLKSHHLEALLVKA